MSIRPATQPSPLAAYQAFCEERRRDQRYRSLPEHKPCAPMLDFSTNDYLGLSQHPLLRAAAQAACECYGVGATGARLLSGNLPIFTELETQIAHDKHTESALFFNSGYQANASVLQALLDPAVLGQPPLVFFDKLNHASLYQGVFSTSTPSSPTLIRYHHNDLNHLNTCLQKVADDPRPKFIVSETVFGMDGDCADLKGLRELAQQYQAVLYLDEAHATGIFGPNGFGLSTALDLTDTPTIIMGTFSKALGAAGAYVACSQSIQHYLINRCGGFIYSTAPSPIQAGVALAAWRLIPSLDKQRQALHATAGDLRQQLQAAGFDTGLSQTHIIPLMLGETVKVLALHAHLTKHNIRSSAIRTPTVPPGRARLRFALTTAHTPTDITQLVETLKSGTLR